MPGRIRYSVFILSLFILVFIKSQIVNAQQQLFLDKNVSFTFTGMPLANALRIIGSKTGVKFSYNPELVQSGRTISMKFNSLPLHEVLKQMLNDPSISFREIGNQIVIFRGDPSLLPLEANQQLIQGKPQIIVPAKKMPDTVYFYRLDTLIINHVDTVFRSISITRFDTIRITDTVFIEKSKPTQKAGKDVKNNFGKNSVKHRKFLENNGLYSALYFELMPGSATFTSTSPQTDGYENLMKKANTGNLAKFSVGVIAGYDYYRVGIRTGIGFTRLGEKFESSYNIETGGFYRNDTVETYYTITGTDTTLFYVTKPVWIPKDSKSYIYKNPNTFKYIDIPLSAKFRLWQNETTEIYALGGVNVAFLVSVNALHINPDNRKEVIWTTKSDLNTILFSWHAGIGTAIKLTPRSGLIAEATYRKQTSSQYKNLPIDKRYGLIGVRIGAYIKF
jgi:hypothetical protein